MSPPTSAAPAPRVERHIGLFGAVTIGVGAIVGGGILVLAGTALAATGPSSLLAFAANGVLAVVTALSFAEMASAIPENGGAYTFARKVLNIRAAFGVGWVVWLAYIVAAALYALGFASFTIEALRVLAESLNFELPTWLTTRGGNIGLALLASAVYTLVLLRQAGGGGLWETWGKVVLFCILIAVGLWAVVERPSGTVGAAYSPFLPGGTSGLLSAMGVTFIALQGFDLISAVGGEVKEPSKTIPKAMLISLAIAMVVYLPLLFVVTTVGVPEGTSLSITELSRKNPDTVIAIAVKNYMGVSGYWAVVLAAILSTLSALQANLMAASRVARSMALDRTLPSALASTHQRWGTPFIAVFATELALASVLMMASDVSSAGAGASLIFLLTFALVQWMSIIARARNGKQSGFSAPAFPYLPAAGAMACTVLALYQAVTVPQAGAIVAVWLGLGSLLYFALFSTRAKAMDATLEALDPQLLKLRGRAPLVLVPVANPKSASAMIEVGQALAHDEVGKVLLLNVVPRARAESGIGQGQAVLQQALLSSLTRHKTPEALMSIAEDPWPEIVRVAKAHRCENLLLGMAQGSEMQPDQLEQVLNEVDCDVTFLRAPTAFNLSEVNKVLVPVSGGGAHHTLRARLLASLGRDKGREITFLGVLPKSSSTKQERTTRHRLEQLADDEVKGRARVKLSRTDDLIGELSREAEDSDLVILGVRQLDDGRKAISGPTLALVTDTQCPIIVLSSHDG